MKSRIDDIDRAILNCLQEDARIQSSEIARRLGNMTARAIRNRLDRLVREGLIAINACAVPERLGLPISADIAMDVEPGMVEAVAQELVALDETDYVAMTTGDTDISVSVVAATLADLQNIINQKLHSIPGVRNTRTYMRTKVLKQSCTWSFPEKLPNV
jgi:Lrp/AsnC family transcriptional regulator, regulator for asnA, asnC and gidA